MADGAMGGVSGDYKVNHDVMKNSSETHINAECDGKNAKVELLL